MKVNIMGRHIGEADSCEIVEDLCIQYYNFKSIPECPIWNVDCLSVNFKTGYITQYDEEGEKLNGWEWMEVSALMDDWTKGGD